MTHRLPLGAALVAVVGLTATAVSQESAAIDARALTSGAAQQVTLGVGDSMVVEGVPIGCAITRRSGRVVIECGRTGKVAGTYMAIVGRRTLKVARLRSATTAKIIFTATHGGGWRVCGTQAATAALAGGCH